MADGRASVTSTAVSNAMRGNRRTDTKPELRIRSALHRRGLRFRKDFTLVASGLRVRPDVVFTRAKVAVFVDGCYWHRCPKHGTSPSANANYWLTKLDRNVARDRLVDAALIAERWIVVRIWEHEVMTDPEGCATRIAVPARKATLSTTD